MQWSSLLNKTWLSIALSSPILLGCEAWFDSGFRNEGVYEARKSGYRVEVIEQGFWNRDSQIVYQSQTLLQICPLAQSQGNPVRLNSQFDRDSQTEILTDPAGRSQPIDWRNAEAILQQTLLQAGFRSLNSIELKGMVRMLRWRGRDPGAEVDAVTIVREDYDGKYDFDRTRPITEWIQSSEIPPCKPAP